MTTSESWLQAFADRLGTAVPSDQEVLDILELAGCAAHGSQRTAAPVACWLAATEGLSPAAALQIARQLVVAED